MKVLIVSDSHGSNEHLKKAILNENPDMFIHLGDVEYSCRKIAYWAGSPATPCIFIKGNCDTYSQDITMLRNVSVFNLKGHRIYCTHGHMQHVDYGLLTLALSAQEQGCDICFFGHTHVPYDSFGDAVSGYARFYESGDGAVPGPRILNPGSITRPRGGSKRGYMVMEMEDDGRYEVYYREV